MDFATMDFVSSSLFFGLRAAVKPGADCDFPTWAE
jgi:hypothetical protein